jgi:glycosyltransferase involved in cell wall biosynthesis
MKILYVDTLLNEANALGRIGAYKRVGELYTFDYRAKARELGKEAPRPMALYRMNSALVELAEETQPDLVQIGKGELLSGRAAREIKQRTNATVVHFYGDLPVEWRERPVKNWVRDIGREVDLTLLYHWDERIFKAHLDAGCQRVGFWGAGVDLDIYYPYPVEQPFDVTFIGNHISADGAQRLALFHALAESGIAVEVFGVRWRNKVGHENVHLHGHVKAGDFAEISSRSKIVLSHNPNEVRGYCSWNRPLRSMACGAMVLCRYFPGLEEVFEKEVHLDWFETPEEAVKLVHHYLSNPGLRVRVAAEGLREVHRNHSWDACVEMLLGYVKEIESGSWTKGTGRFRDGTEMRV